MQFDYEGNPLKYELDKYFALVNNGQDFALIQHFVFGKLFIGGKFFYSQREE